MEVESGLGSEINMNRIDKDGNTVDLSKEVVYTLEVGANRYDLLCLEGIAQNIRSYLEISPLPRLSVKPP